MQTYLPDLLKHIPDPVPLHVAMFRNPLSRPLVAPGIPTTMFGRCMYLRKRFTDILLIATGCSSEGGSGEGESSEDVGQPFEIPMDIDVDFEVIKLSEEEKAKLNDKSKKLRERLNDKDVRHHRYGGSLVGNMCAHACNMHVAGMYMWSTCRPVKFVRTYSLNTHLPF